MSAFLFERVLIDAEIEAVFSDAAMLAALLQFEVALAQAQARTGVIPAAAADGIAASAQAFSVDGAALAREAAHAGSLAIPWVERFTRHVGSTGAQAARYVHFGATSQDALDTALALRTRTALTKLDDIIGRCQSAAVLLAKRHARTPALARTLMQPAGVTTMGLKAAQWAHALRQAQRRLQQSARAGLAVSLGGAIGNLAAYGEKGARVRAALAESLALADAGASWHTQRECWVALACDVGLLAGCIGKIANDIALMAQFEIGELAEPSEAGRGGSSAMPHKRNPVLCMRALAATHAVPSLVAQLLAAMKQEHERALGAWQAEIAAWPRVFTHTYSAAAALAALLEGLQVDSERCRANIDRLHGVLCSDRLAELFAGAIGKLEAHELVGQLARRALDERRPMSALAQQHAAGDARLAHIAAADIDACFEQDTTVRLSAQQTQSLIASL
jgi:3-carboxy-cis,cis-muconate cycloisomerase